jgi:hypothetical protein
MRAVSIKARARSAGLELRAVPDRTGHNTANRAARSVAVSVSVVLTVVVVFAVMVVMMMMMVMVAAVRVTLVALALPFALAANLYEIRWAAELRHG